MNDDAPAERGRRTPLFIVIFAAAVTGCGGTKEIAAPPARPAAPIMAVMMQWQGAFCGVSEAGSRLIEDAAQWKKLWLDIGSQDPGEPDFKTHYAVAVFLGQRSTGGYAARLLEPATEEGSSIVRYRISVPKGLVIQAITQPYHVRVYPRAGLPVRVEALPE